MHSTPSNSSTDISATLESLKQSCLDNQCRPQLERGKTLKNGVFFRNLKKDQVAPIYEKQPQFGHRLKLKNWNWTNDSGHMELSVNLVSCILSPACSIRVHPYADKYEHVWEINLDVLNEFFLMLKTRMSRYISQNRPTTVIS